MRGTDERTGSLFSYVDLEARIRKDHPFRAIRGSRTRRLEAIDFAALYSAMGRPSIAPEKLLRAMLLQAFYSIRSADDLSADSVLDRAHRWNARTFDAAWPGLYTPGLFLRFRRP